MVKLSTLETQRSQPLPVLPRPTTTISTNKIIIQPGGQKAERIEGGGGGGGRGGCRVVLSWRNAREEEGSWKVSGCPTHFPHPLPGCCRPPQAPHRLILEGICPLFFFFFQMQRRTFFAERQPGGNVHGRHKPLRFLMHTLLSSLFVSLLRSCIVPTLSSNALLQATEP